MPDHFQKSWRLLIGIEGGYADVKNDAGGKTKYGITEKLARRYGYVGDMKDLDEPTALKIAKAEFWDPLRLDSVAGRSWQIANEIFDSAYNMGAPRVAPWLQRALNALNRQQADYPDVPVDGVYGDKTLAALEQFLFKRGYRGELVLLGLLNALQTTFYLSLAEAKATQEDFLFGWVLHRGLLPQGQ